jgi:hypothetical protein
MSVDWSVVLRSHVIKACEDCDKREAPEGREAKNTFLLWSGRCYPAKYIRGLAYRRATDVPLDPDRDYSGGKETSDFFQELGFDTEYKGQTIRGLPILDRIDKWHRALQEAYRTWVQGPTSLDDAIAFLKETKAKDEPKPQKRSDLFDSHWNPVTIPIVKEKAEGPYKRLKEALTEEVVCWLEDLNETHPNLYHLFFIHPVRHELWFYQEHYADPNHPAVYGYVSRMKHEICERTRYNLKNATKYKRTPKPAQARNVAARFSLSHSYCIPQRRVGGQQITSRRERVAAAHALTSRSSKRIRSWPSDSRRRPLRRTSSISG